MNLLQRMLGRSDIFFGETRYMRRWKLINRAWFGLRIHNILRSDTDRELHDHPFTFLSIVLWGGYWEHTLDGRRTWHGTGSFLIRTAECLHRLEMERPAWTLVFRGAHRRTWGYLLVDRWIPWDQFIEARYRVPKRDRKFKLLENSGDHQ